MFHQVAALVWAGRCGLKVFGRLGACAEGFLGYHLPTWQASCATMLEIDESIRAAPKSRADKRHRTSCFHPWRRKIYWRAHLGLPTTKLTNMPQSHQGFSSRIFWQYYIILSLESISSEKIMKQPIAFRSAVLQIPSCLLVQQLAHLGQHQTENNIMACRYCLTILSWGSAESIVSTLTACFEVCSVVPWFPDVVQPSDRIKPD